MGEVYRGRDTNLQRDVAIKVLPDELARDPERTLRSSAWRRIPDSSRYLSSTAKVVAWPSYTCNTRYVYTMCMSRVRTNIELEDDYIRAIMDRYGVHTKTEAVDLALRHLAGQPMTREEALAMRGARAIEEPPADEVPAKHR